MISAKYYTNRDSISNICFQKVGVNYIYPPICSVNDSLNYCYSAFDGALNGVLMPYQHSNKNNFVKGFFNGEVQISLSSLLAA